MVGRYWTEVRTGGRLALAGAVTVVLVLLGAGVPHRRSGLNARLRAVLWLSAAVGLGAVLELAAAEVFDWREQAVASLAFGGAAVLAATLWYLHRHPVLHVAMMAATAGAAVAATTLLPYSALLPGVAAWASV